MKKILAVLLSLCLLLGLCSCSSAPIEVKKFASETEMQEYLQGIWIDTWSEDELIFFDNGIAVRWETVSGRLTDFQNTFDPLVKEQSYKVFLEMNVSDRIAELEKGWLSAEEEITCHFKPKKGELSIGDADYTVYVGDGILYDGSSGGEFEKLSDTPSYTVPGLIEKFEEAHKNYEPPLSLCKLTNEEYAKALMELHPETKNFPVAYEDDNEHIFSDTGNSASSGGQYDSILMWTDNTVLFSKRANSTDTYKVILSESSLLIQDTHHRESWETLIADALALFGDAPGLPTPQELVAEFREKGENYVLNPSLFEYTTEIDGITFEMDEAFAANNNSKLLILRFE